MTPPSIPGDLRGAVAPGRIVVWLALAACLVLFVVLRMPGVGHLLMWDEAQDVIAARSLTDGSGDPFMRLWAHPPALPTVSLLMQPLRPGFAERYEMLVLAINASGMVVLFLLNRRIYGTAVALWSCFFLAVLRGAVFYDVWIKGGSVVSLATTAALAALVGGNPLFCGLCLGIALLDKETAVLPCMAVGMLALLDARYRNLKTLAGIAITVLLAAGWWYLFLGNTLSTWLQFATGTAVDPSSGMPWYSHFYWLYGDVGFTGCILLLMGSAWMAMRRSRMASEATTRPYAWWPLSIAVVTYVVFTACRNKSPWFTMFVYPSLATIQAVGIAGVLGSCSARFPRLRPVWLVGAVACALLMFSRGATLVFEGGQRRLMGRTWQDALRTRAIAEAVNARIAPGERLLATTLNIYGPAWHSIVSPHFVLHLTNVPTTLVSFLVSPDCCIDEIVSNRADWALLSPYPGAQTVALTNFLDVKFDLAPVVVLDGGSSFLYRTTSVYRE